MLQIEELQEKILQEMDLSKEVADDELIEIIHRIIEKKGRENYIPLKEKVGMGKDLFNAFRKLDILQELMEDDEITEIMINGTQNIFIEEIFTQLYGNDYENKLINEYNAAKMGLYPDGEMEQKITRYRAFLQERAERKAEIERICNENGIN